LNFQPYPDFDPNALREYEFVPLPTLKRNNIVREIVKDEDEDDEDGDDWIEFEDEDEGEFKGKGKATAKGKEKAEPEPEDENDEDGNDENNDDSDGDGTTDVFGTATAYKPPFLGFPILNHHAHPFYVIDNALPKLQAHREDLRPQHLRLLHLMEQIQVIWTGRLSKTTSQKLPKPRKFNDDDNDNDKDDNDTDKDISKHRTRSMTRKKQSSSKLPSTSQAKASAGTSKSRRHKTAPALPASRSSDLGTSHTKAFLYDQPSEITAWSAEVAADGSDFRMDDTISWSDDEPVHPPINKWDKWHVPYSQPRKYADFSSSDWPMYFYSYALWMPSLNT
jgi:hypothetical protein